MFTTNNNKSRDVLDPACVKRIQKQIGDAGCMAVWFGMSCGTFLSARCNDGKGPKPFRNRKYLIGFTDLKGRDKLSVDLANRQVEAVYELCNLCIAK